MSDQLMTVLGADGTVKRKDRPELSDQDLLFLHRTMVRTRALDERAMTLQRRGAIGFYVPSFGEEAAGAGSAFALEKEDWIVPSYRQPVVALMRGVAPEAMFDNCFGNEADNARGRQMPVHYTFREANFCSISSPIGTQIVQGAGVAMAMAYRKDDRVAMTYFGDGATSSNDFHSGMNFAGVFRAPCVFVCINNQWAISLEVSGQTGNPDISEKAVAYGMPGVRVDGNDVLAVYEASRAAVERARSGEGPTLLELLTFRMGPHSSSDDPSRYRPGELEEEWRKKDPIKRFEAFLLREELLTESAIKAIHEEAQAEMAEAARAAEKKPLPQVSSLFDDVYASQPPHVTEQRERLLAEGGTHEADEDAAFPL